MNSRGRPCRPAGRREETAAPAAPSSAFFAFPLATGRRYPRPWRMRTVPTRLSQRLDQQLVLGRPSAEVGHRRQVDQLGEELFAALDRARLDLGQDRAVDRARGDFGATPGHGSLAGDLAAAAGETLADPLHDPVAARLRAPAVPREGHAEEASAS